MPQVDFGLSTVKTAAKARNTDNSWACVANIVIHANLVLHMHKQGISHGGQSAGNNDFASCQAC